MNPDDPLIGRQLANFRVERLLARGGMGRVYYGWDVKLQRPVAIKVIGARYQDDQGYARRFVQEAQAIATWDNPNILQVYYADDQDDLYYYVMEYVPGVDLEQLIQQRRQRGETFSCEEALRLLRPVAEALDYAHRKGVIHRDVKPANILVGESGRVVLTDFGLAMDVNQGSQGEIFGSPRYIAPEQARDSSTAGPASDLYSLGVVLYELLTGSPPFDDPSPTALALQHIMLEPPPPRSLNPKLSQAVEQVLLKAIRKEPADRYRSGKELIAALEKALETPEPGAAPHTAQPAPGGPPSRVVERIIGRLGAAPAHPGKSKEPTAPIRTSQAVWLGGACILAALLCIAASALGLALASPGSSTPQITAAAGTAPLEAAIPSATRTSGATETPTQPAQTPSPALIDTPPSPTESLALEKSGKRFVLFYNDTSLYFLNHSGQDVSIYPFAFELLDSKGDPIRRMEGWYWGQIYSKFRNNYCVVLEVFGSHNPLEPAECQGRTLVVRTPTSDSGLIFWVSEKGAKEFRVIWQDQEAARCSIRDGECEVYLP